MPQDSPGASLPHTLSSLLARSLELKMGPDQLLVLFSLLALIGILHLLEARTNPVQQAVTPDLTATLASLLQAKGKGGSDLVGSLMRNPAVVSSLLGLLTGAPAKGTREKGDVVALPAR